MLEVSANEKLKVFISYSRKDSSDFADELVAGLELAGFAPYLDRHDIAAGEDWEARLAGLIQQADTVVFVISPEAVRSERCKWEVNNTVALSKRLLPVVFKPAPDAEIPKQLRSRQFVRFDTGRGLTRPLSQLASALREDTEWIREHTRLGELAARWQARSRPESLLLRGDDLDAAKVWISKRKADAPGVTELQQAFVNASEDEAEARRNTERRRLAEMASAQEAQAKALADRETALKQAADAQRIRAMLRNLLLLVMTLAVAALGSLLYKINQKNEQLTEQIQKANAATIRAQSAEGRALLDKGRAQRAELVAITNECSASRQILKISPQDAEALYNYLSCGLRLGYALIRENELGDSEKFLSRLREAALSKYPEEDDAVRSFYLLLISEWEAVARCAATRSKSTDRAEAISHLAGVIEQVLQFEPPPSLSQRWQKELDLRWREEALRGIVYISICSRDNSDQEIAFQYAQELVQRLSKLPTDQADAARLFARALDHLAWMALITGRNSEAMEVSEHAVQLVSEFGIDDLGSVRLNHAHALLFNGRKEEARKEYQQLDPDDVRNDMEQLMSLGMCQSLFSVWMGRTVRCTG
jgi:hypothetical protein